MTQQGGNGRDHYHYYSINIIIIVTVAMLLYLTEEGGNGRDHYHYHYYHHRQSGPAAHLTEQGDVGGGRCEAGVRTKALDERRRSRDLQ